MYLYYRGYWFDNNEAQITISKRATYNDFGIIQKVTETWSVVGIKQAASQAALTTALDALKAALYYNGGDIGLYLDDQATLTTHYIVNSRTLSGTRITSLDFPEGAGAEYSTFRTYSFMLEADFVANLNQNFLEYQESVTFSGNGGPMRIFLDVAQGPPQEQITMQQTTYRATQQGSAKNWGVAPTPPGPIWPQAELGPLREFSPITVSMQGGRQEQTVSWKYVFESASPLVL